MEHLDIEQQLRIRQSQQTSTLGASAVPPLSYLHHSYRAAAGDAIALFAGIPFVSAVLFVLVALLTKSKRFTSLAKLTAENHRNTGASVIVANTTPTTFSLCMAAWMLLMAVHTVCDVLREVSQQHYRAIRQANVSAVVDLSLLHTLPVDNVSPHPVWGLAEDLTTLYPPLLQWIMTPTAFLFAARYAGMVCMWCYVLFAGRPLEAGLFGALIAFFPNFYAALLLDGSEPDRWPVWVTLASFLMSLASLWAFGAPVIQREFRELKREMQGHAAGALFKDRPEMRELRARNPRATTRAKQN